MNLIKWIFKKYQALLEDNNSRSLFSYDTHEQLIIEKVIELLREKPDCFTARWFNGKFIDKSVRSRNGEILIMIDTGQIIQPMEPLMTKKQKMIIRQLLEPIIKKDSDYLIERISSELFCVGY